MLIILQPSPIWETQRRRPISQDLVFPDFFSCIILLCDEPLTGCILQDWGGGTGLKQGSAFASFLAVFFGSTWIVQPSNVLCLPLGTLFSFLGEICWHSFLELFAHLQTCVVAPISIEVQCVADTLAVVMLLYTTFFAYFHSIDLLYLLALPVGFPFNPQNFQKVLLTTGEKGEMHVHLHYCSDFRAILFSSIMSTDSHSLLMAVAPLMDTSRGQKKF